MIKNIIGVIPAAGSGTRLLPYTRAIPKEMYPILGKTPIDYALESMQDVGIKRVFIIVGHKKGAIIDYVGDGSRYNLKVVYVYQEEQLGLGHAILQMEDFIDTTFLTILGDTIITPGTEIQELVNIHFNRCENVDKPISTILLNEVEDPSDYGVARIFENKRIVELKEKPNERDRINFEKDGKYLAISGVYILEPDIFKFLRTTIPGKNNEIQLTDAMERAIEVGCNIYGYILKGDRYDIGSWKSLLDVEQKLLTKNL
jgi:dTDP-glucose pyrophosphorylase